LLLSDLNESLRRGGFSLNHYDLIHSRCVSPGIKKERWRRYVAELAALLRRDGWVQLVEYYYIIQSDSGRLTDQHALQQWGTVYRAAMERERDPRVGRNLRGLLRDANLRDIHERTYNIPIGGWSSGKCGNLCVVCFLSDLLRDQMESFVARLYCKPPAKRVKTLHL